MTYTMPNIAVRADASIEIGSGHIMRCLTLAEQLRHEGKNVTFICRLHPGHLCDVIQTRGFEVIRLPATEGLENNAEVDAPSHWRWLGSTQEQDALETVETLKYLRVDTVIVDHYAIDYRWERIIKRHVNKLMVIDDLADRKHECDVLLDQNYYLDPEKRYAGLVPPYCHLLLGPKHALLRSEFVEQRRKMRHRDGSIKSIFIFFGGSDVTNETNKAIDAVLMLDRTDIKVDIVAGPNNPHADQIKRKIELFSNMTLHINVNNMAELMNQADLAIGAGGTATWERCFLGLPTINISIADNQVEVANAAAHYGAIENLGSKEQVTVRMIYNKLLELMHNPEKVRFMSKKALEIMS